MKSLFKNLKNDKWKIKISNKKKRTLLFKFPFSIIKVELTPPSSNIVFIGKTVKSNPKDKINYYISSAFKMALEQAGIYKK